jgi:hypothetical protein
VYLQGINPDTMKNIIYFIFCSIFCTSLYASDLAREKRLSDQIIDSILDGEAVFLKTEQHKFLSIYMESESDSPKGAAIILHGRGYHPNWKDVVYPLRTGLPDHGWHTLSLQMPVLEKTAKYFDYIPVFPESFPRIESAITFLESKGIKNIILIAHSCSVHMSMDWIRSRGGRGINAFIGIGMGATDYKQKIKTPFPLNKITIPILDIYGSDDYPAVINMATERFDLIQKAANPLSEQRVIFDANHYMTEHGDELLNEVSNWLKQIK